MLLKTNYTRKRSLLVTNDFPPAVSGIGTVFYNLFRLQAKERYIILSPWSQDCEKFDNKNDLPVLRVNIPVGESRISKVVKTVTNIIYVFCYALTHRVTKIHCGQILSNGMAGFLCKKILKIPYIVWVYGSETIRFGGSEFLSSLMRKILASAELVVVNSSFTENEYLRFGVDKVKVLKITPGVNTDLFKPAGKPDYLINKYNLFGKTVLLTVGRLDERKGHDTVIDALYQLKKECPKIVYLIVGKGREEQRLRVIVDSKGLRDDVIFAGYVTDEELPDYYNLCDIFILPNRETESAALKGDYEGFGTVFLEASACGKPVIGGLSGGVRDAIDEGVTGFLVDPRSIEDIAEVLKNLVPNDDNKKRIGNAGRLRVEQEFDWRILANRLEKIL